MQPIEEQHLQVYFDEAQKLVRVHYPEQLTPDITVRVYQWMTDLIHEIGVQNVLGGVFDFRNVQKIHEANTQVARSQSKTMNQQIDLSRVAVALIVGNLFQEQMVKVSMKLTTHSERISVVFSEQEAFDFIREFHASQPS